MRSPRAWLKDLALGGVRVFARPLGVTRVILLYHSVGSSWGIPVSHFEAQIAYLQSRFRLLRLGDMCDSAWGDERPIACITFDDGYLDNYELALPVLDHFGVMATFFIPSAFPGRWFLGNYGYSKVMTFGQVRDLSVRGHEIGSHTATHPRLTKIPLDKAREEITTSKRVLEDQLGRSVVSFSYPKGDFNDAVKRIVREAGFRCAVITKEALVGDAPDWFALPRVNIDPSVGTLQFRAKLSPGIELFERLRGRG